MSDHVHSSRETLASEESLANQVDLLVKHIDRTYVTAGQPGVLALVREMFRGMSPAALTALVYQMGLEVEPGQEAEPGEPRSSTPA